MAKGKIIAHFCGGAAANIADHVMRVVADLGEGFSDVTFNYLDTSRANYDKLPDARGDLFLVVNKAYGSKTMEGSGGERSGKLGEIAANIPDYLNNKKFLKKEPDEYHMVVFSGSGGSGNTAGVLVTKELLKRSIPVFCVVVGDSSNAMFCINTLNTLATLNKFAIELGKPLSVIYYNNSNFFVDGLSAAEREVNKQLLVTLSAVSLFLSGANGKLDNQDIIHFIDQSHYRTISLKPGLYGLHVYSKDINLPEGATPTNARILTTEGQDFALRADILHYKQGVVDVANVFETIKPDQFPLYFVTYSNFFALEEKALKPQSENYYNIADSIVNNQVTGSSRSSVDDETGMIL